MVGVRPSWERHSVRAGKVAAATLAAVFVFTGAAAGDQSTIVATVAPSLAVSVSAKGTISTSSSTEVVTVTREQVGDRVVITVIPQ
jgi:hypothetical protein